MWASALTRAGRQGAARARRGSCGAARAGPSPSGRSKPAGVTSIGDPLEQLAQQRVAVRVRAARRHADEHVAGGDVGAGEQRRPLGDADERAGDVEGAGRVDARHLGRLAAEQRAAGRFARLGHAGHDVGDEVGVERARRDVVEEEQRSRRLHEDVADAVVDDVVAERAHTAQLGAASSTFVPTPSVDATRIGSSIAAIALAENDAAEAADAAHAPRRRGCARRRRFICSTARLPSAMSTPAAA